jgi:acetylornithine/succinyldiaminopimelate/putrescine aminotransferase
VEIRIGMAHTGRELSFETAEASDTVKKAVGDALDSSASHVTFTDTKGNSYLVPTAGIAYVELGTEESRRVGFVA